MLSNRSWNKRLGDYGEKIALFYLVNKGHRIIAKNMVIARLGEVDILSYRDMVLHINEVKTERTSANQDQAGKPGLSEQSLSAGKIRKLKLLTQKLFNSESVLCVTEELDIRSVQINGICISVAAQETAQGFNSPFSPKSIRLRFYPNIDLP